MIEDYAKSRHSSSEDGFFCRFTFGQFFALLVIEVFTIFFVFYLGARYGPRFLGLEKKSPMIVGSESEPVKVQTTDDPEVAAMAKDLVEKAKTPELKERLAEMLKRPSEGNPVPPADVGKVEAAPPSEINSAQRLPQESVMAKPAEELPMEQMPQKPAEVAKAPAPQEGMPMRQVPQGDVEKGAVRIKSAEGSKYALQIGSYQQMNEANTAVEKWRAKGYPAYLMIADIPDRGRWYRVRVGGFGSRDEARRYQKEFQTQETVETIIVMNEQ